MPTEYTVEIDGVEYPYVDIRYVRDYKFYGKSIEVLIPEWIVEIAGDDAIVIKRDGETVTSGTVKKITPVEGIGKGIGMYVKGYTKEQKHATLLAHAQTYNADPHTIIIADIGSSDLTDDDTDVYGSNIVVEFGTNVQSKFSRKMVYEEVAFITGWELYADPVGALDFKSQCGTDRSATVMFKHGELLESWHEPHMVNYLVLKTKVIVLGAYEEDFEFYGITGAGTNVLTIERKNLIDDNTCELASAALYADMQNALQAGVINVIDTYEGAAYDVYDTVRIEDARFDLAADMRIYRIERHIDKDGEHTKIFYTNITKLTSNGRFLLDLGKEYLGKGQRVLRDFGRTAVNVIDLRALDSAGKVDFSVIYVTNKGHAYLSGVTANLHHGKSHASRHETVGGADDLDTQNTGAHEHPISSGIAISVPAHTHSLAYLPNAPFYLPTSKSTLYAASVSGGSPTTAFIAVGSTQQANIVTGDAESAEDGAHGHSLSGSSTSGGAHDHNVTSSPTPDVDEAPPGEELIEFIVDELLPDGRRRVKIHYPEFNMFSEVTHPIGSTDERVLKDAKGHYHALLDAREAMMLPENQPRSMAFAGKKLKWDIKKEKVYMAAKLTETGEEEREENERRRLKREAMELEKEKKK